MNNIGLLPGLGYVPAYLYLQDSISQSRQFFLDPHSYFHHRHVVSMILPNIIGAGRRAVKKQGDQIGYNNSELNYYILYKNQLTNPSQLWSVTHMHVQHHNDQFFPRCGQRMFKSSALNKCRQDFEAFSFLTKLLVKNHPSDRNYSFISCLISHALCSQFLESYLMYEVSPSGYPD